MENDFSLLTIPSDTKYWLVRANGGKFLNDYIENDFVSIAHNNVHLSDIQSNNSPKDAMGNIDIRQLYTEKYPDESKHWLTTASAQCDEFLNEMKIGDIVITPGTRSNEFAIGIIKGATFDADQKSLQQKKERSIVDGLQYHVDTNIKRRPVSWIKIIRRESLPGELYWTLSAHQAVFNISKYANFIDPLIYPLFIKDNKINLIVNTTGLKDLTLSDWKDLTDLVKSESDSENYSESVKMEAEVHCPGVLQFITDPNNIKAIANIIHNITSMGGNHALAYLVYGSGGGVTFIAILRKALKLAIGTNGLEDGLLIWIDKYKLSHLQSKIALENLKKQRSSEKTLPTKPVITDPGTAIPKKDQTKK